MASQNVLKGNKQSDLTDLTHGEKQTVIICSRKNTWWKRSAAGEELELYT